MRAVPGLAIPLAAAELFRYIACCRLFQQAGTTSVSSLWIHRKNHLKLIRNLPDSITVPFLPKQMIKFIAGIIGFIASVLTIIAFYLPKFCPK
jgi:hypothetical protein